MNTILHFDSVYCHQELTNLLPDAAELLLSSMDGVRGYCDNPSALRSRLEKITPDGIHFLGSGNYHYMSLLFLEKLTTPFSLVVFDHHTDMQPSLFGDLLSCGSWILEALKTLPLLKEILIIGVGEESLDGTKEITFSSGDFSKIHETETVLTCCFDTKMVPVTILKKNADTETIRNYLMDTIHDPVYLSIDKDVLSKDELETDWDQGCMTLTGLKELCHELGKHFTILGTDICGEADESSPFFQSRWINQELIRCFSEET